MSEDFSAWIGRSEELFDRIDAARCNALLSALGQPSGLAEGSEMPLLHHWLHFWNVQPPAGLGPDGHPAKGGFLPPVPLPRRMWAGGRLRFEKPLLIGERVTKLSTIKSVTAKSGKSGDLVFVTVEHRLSGESGLAIVEEQDLVYKGETPPGALKTPAAEGPVPSAPWQASVMPDTVLLFRYSALTMNGHRIHYDLPYAMDEEAYPALVVHGPLQATLLADLAVKSLGKPLATFDFRGQVPAFAGTRLDVCGEPAEGGAAFWTEQSGGKNMVATVTTV
ncbi:MaoC family dehydratase N-terminal domain-containing protein [Novosphingobium sp. TH158]|uniref:FAS1-like dehydratase domain-containing protein n=1 Tax=Novosphingobium sp. TH158 TaxID=2067455 RepID=UPI0013046F17|nr:MaoC family dehydratase N-terminal domain-containing protein [Novosphingobium sp. TH158]